MRYKIVTHYIADSVNENLIFDTASKSENKKIWPEQKQKKFKKKRA